MIWSIDVYHCHSIIYWSVLLQNLSFKTFVKEVLGFQECSSGSFEEQLDYWKKCFDDGFTKIFEITDL